MAALTAKDVLIKPIFQNNPDCFANSGNLFRLGGDYADVDRFCNEHCSDAGDRFFECTR